MKHRPAVTHVVLIAWISACGGATSQANAPSTAGGDPLRDVEAEEIFRRGVALEEAQDFVRAEQYFAAAREQGIADERVVPHLVRVCVESSRMSTAIGYAEPYLERHPSDHRLRELVATLHIAVGNTEQARAHLLRLVEAEPDQVQPYFLLGTLAQRANDMPEMERWYSAYLEHDSNGPRAEQVQSALSQYRRLQNLPIRLEAHTEAHAETRGGSTSEATP